LSVPRLLFVPTHKTGLAYAVASLLAEIAARGRVPVRLHHLGALGSAAVWDRWGGSGFIDPGLYGMKAAGDLYVKSMAEAQLSLLSASVGLYDDGPSGSWTPALVARKLDAPVVLLLDVRGWGRTLEHVLNGVRAAAEEINIAGVIFCGARDGAHVESIRRLVCGPNLPLVGALMDRDALTWDSPAPGVANVPPFGDVTEMVALMEQRLDLDLVEQLAGQRGYLPDGGTVRDSEGPLVMVASCRGFTPWSRDAIDMLRSAGASVRRLDLAEDRELPHDTAGVIIAGHLWQDALPHLADNYSLMRDLRVHVEDGLPLLALGGGMTYLLRRVQDSYGRAHELAGVIPAGAEIISDLEEAEFLEVKAEKENPLLEQGELVRGWVVQDVELAGSPVSRDFALTLKQPEWGAPLGEGASTPQLLCSRVLIHPAACRSGVGRFVAACRAYASER